MCLELQIKRNRNELKSLRSAKQTTQHTKPATKTTAAEKGEESRTQHAGWSGAGAKALASPETPNVSVVNWLTAD